MGKGRIFKSGLGLVGSWCRRKYCFDRLWRVKHGVDEMIKNSIGCRRPGEETIRLCVGLSWVGVLVFEKTLGCCVSALCIRLSEVFGV